MGKKLAIVILNCTMIFMAGTFCAFGQEKEVDLKAKRITVKMEKQPLWIVFKYLIENYDIAIGLEQSTLDGEHNDYAFETNLRKGVDKREVNKDGKIEIPEKEKPRINVERHFFTVNVENGKLEDVLNQIVRQMKIYKWEINDDVVNIFPIRGRDKRYKNLLELKIKYFNLRKPFDIGSIRKEIFNLPEVIKFLEKNEIFSTVYLSSTLLENLDRLIYLDIEFSDLTLRELLNKITKVKSGGWILQKNPMYGSKEKEYIEIDI